MTETHPSWLDDDAAHCWHPYTQHGIAPTPLPIVGAEGSWLTLADGTRMLDAIASWWCCLHGHGRRELVDALTGQATRLDHVLFAGCSHEPASRLASKLSEVAPPGLKRVFFSDNGSTAVEVALKAAYQAAVRRGEAHRTTYIALEGGYHGDTFGAMAVGDPDPFFLDYAPLMFKVARAPRDADALSEVLAEVGDQAAAFIIEPAVQGAAGMRPIPDHLLLTARQLCDRYGVTLIADEVFTGFGRTGSLFACERAGVTPDALCLSKGLTSGMLPLSATLFPESTFDVFRSSDRSHMFFHGHTFTANPLACTVALASLELVRVENTPAKLSRIGGWIEASLEPLTEREDVSIRRIGGIVAVELDAKDGGYLSDIAPRLGEACLKHSPDVLLRPLGNVIYAVPPASTTEADCALIASRMRELVLRVLERGS